MISLSNKWLLTVLPILIGSFILLGLLAFRETESFRKEFESFNERLAAYTQEIKTARHDVGDSLKESLDESEDLWLQRAASAVSAGIETIQQTALICAKNGIVSRFIQADEALREFSKEELNAYLDDLIDAYELSEIVIVDVDGQEIARQGEYVVPEGGDPILDGFELPNLTSNEKYSSWFKLASQTESLERFSFDLYKDRSLETPTEVVSIATALRYDSGRYVSKGQPAVAYIQFVIPIDRLLRVVAMKSSVGGVLVVEDARIGRFIVKNDHEKIIWPYQIEKREIVVPGFMNLCSIVPKSVVDLALEPMQELTAGVEGLSAAHHDFSQRFGASTRRSHWMMGTSIGVLLLITALLIVRLSNRLAHELDQVEDAAKRVVQGDLSSEVTAGSMVREFNELAESIERMRQRLAGQIQTLDAEVASQTQALTDRNEDLAREIETRRAAEELAHQASRAKSEFLATMSHEIRTPLNGVVGMIQKLRVTGLSQQQHEYLDILKVSSDSLLTLINDILDFSKIESGRMELEQIPFSVQILSKTTLQLFRTRFEEKGIALENTCDVTGGDWLYGDPNRIRQILINLVGNALKFTESGKVRVSIASLSSPKSTLVIDVEDTGVGIPVEAQGHLFQQFVQADSSTTREHGGTGLGLAISDKLVKLMGGAIFFSSEEGTGTRFQVRIPSRKARPMDIPRSAGGTKLPVPQEYTFSEGHILVVDDSVMNLKVIEILLKTLPLKISKASSGEEALEIVKSENIDLVLMDCQMPEMDGYEATRLIRALGSEYSNARLPIVALTGNVTSDGKEACCESGMDGFLSKPVDMTELTEVLNRHLSKALGPLESS